MRCRRLVVLTCYPGVGAISPSVDQPLLAYPSREKEGSIQIFNVLTLQPVCAIQAHRTAVTKMAFNIDGSLLATASDRGTILRVFSSNNGQKLYQFRRGTYPTTIHCISFNLQSNMLCVSSDSDTVHIFKLINSLTSPQVTGTSSIISAILPERMGEALESIRDFAHLKLPSNNMPSLCAISRYSSFCLSRRDPMLLPFSHSTMPHVMVVTADGYFLVYAIDFEKGGECQLLRKHSFNSVEEGTTASVYSV